MIVNKILSFEETGDCAINYQSEKDGAINLGNLLVNVIDYYYYEATVDVGR